MNMKPQQVKKYVFSFIIVLILVAGGWQNLFCKKKDSVKAMVKEWAGKKIEFPQNPIFTVMGIDTVDFKLNAPGYKIVSYIELWDV